VLEQLGDAKLLVQSAMENLVRPAP
jgi:hypothetical protein